MAARNILITNISRRLLLCLYRVAGAHLQRSEAHAYVYRRGDNPAKSILLIESNITKAFVWPAYNTPTTTTTTAQPAKETL